MAHSTCRARTTSKLRGRQGRRGRVRQPNRALTPAARALARAALIIAGAKSSPVTAYPSAASSTDSVPVPQPMSATAAGAAGQLREQQPPPRLPDPRVEQAVVGLSSKVAAWLSQ